MLDAIFREHGRLPLALRAWVVVPATLAFTIASGLLFTLPPGPLCDEGMILFMEGGCDWGDSNVFFFSKLSLLVVFNLVFVIAWLRDIRGGLGFAPHFLVLALVTLMNLSGGLCDTYYSHPNGSIGQMTFESMAFALLGVTLVTEARSRSAGRLIVTLIGWNAAYLLAFQLGLLFTNHWTWLHTFFIVVSLCALREALVSRSALPYVP